MTVTGVTTEIVTTADVAEIPAAVATAVSEYEPAVANAEVRANGAATTDPKSNLFAKNWTFVTVPLPTEALARIFMVAGAANTAPVKGLVRVTEGGGGATAGVVRL